MLNQRFKIGIKKLEINLLKSTQFLRYPFYDIGYCKLINKLNFHSLNGAVFLESIGVDYEIVCAVANHSGALMLSEGKFDDIYNEKYLIDTDLKKLYLDVIDLIDAHVDNCGDIVSVNERYLSMSERYGMNSIQAKIFKTSIDKIKRLEKEFKWNLL